MSKKVNVSESLELAAIKHNGKYDYSKVDYKRWNIPVTIICPEHGEFKQTLHNHLNGQGCPKCGKKQAAEKLSMDNETFIKRASEIHNGKYNYTKTEYKNNHTKVCIICPEHGEFWQIPSNHLNGSGCPKCSGKIRKTNETFKEEATKIHNGKYDYSKVNYINNSTKVSIICPKHGEFWQTPNSHLRGNGCPVCRANRKLDNDRFIQRAKIVHNNKYDYTRTNYINEREPICVICPEHGEFWQIARNHLYGHGCPKCGHNRSHLEEEIAAFLNENAIVYEEQKKFPWLKYDYPLSLDFYLPDYYIAIECQGEQHFKPVNYFGGASQLKYIKDRDKKKKELCEKYGIRILYFSNETYDENIITDKNNLLNEIKK